MGELKKHTEDWLAECGYELGYDWNCLPSEDDFDKIINDLRQQIPNLQMQLNQAEGYKQALIDLEKEPEEKDKT